jgi:hypothetical protein
MALHFIHNLQMAQKAKELAPGKAFPPKAMKHSSLLDSLISYMEIYLL